MKFTSSDMFQESCMAIAESLFAKIEESDPDIIIPDCFLPPQFLVLMEAAGWRYVVTSASKTKDEKVTALIKEEDLAFSTLNEDSMHTETMLHLRFTEALCLIHQNQEIYRNLENSD